MKREKEKLPDTLVDYLDDLTKVQKDVIVASVNKFRGDKIHHGLLPFVSRINALSSVVMCTPIRGNWEPRRVDDKIKQQIATILSNPPAY